MQITLIEPYFSGSHRQWAEGYKQSSRHRIDILQLKGQFWKWRMHGGAVSLAKTYLENLSNPDLILTTDMLDLTTFLALTRKRTASIPVAVYFHENQLSYPWSPTDRDIAKKRDKHYGFINYVSALAADSILFNSDFHRTSFLKELPGLLKHFPDYRDMENITRIEAKSNVLHLGLDFSLFRTDHPVPIKQKEETRLPIVLWNSRWEYDKNPEDFFTAVEILLEQGLEFKLVLLGENFKKQPDIFNRAREKLGDRILRFGFVEDSEEYAGWLQASDILPVTSNQDFFGIAY